MKRKDYLLIQRQGASGFMENLYFGEGFVRDINSKSNSNIRNCEATEMTVLYFEDGTVSVSTRRYLVYNNQIFPREEQPFEMPIDRKNLPLIKKIFGDISKHIEAQPVQQPKARGK